MIDAQSSSSGSNAMLQSSLRATKPRKLGDCLSQRSKTSNNKESKFDAQANIGCLSKHAILSDYQQKAAILANAVGSIEDINSARMFMATDGGLSTRFGKSPSTSQIQSYVLKMSARNKHSNHMLQSQRIHPSIRHHLLNQDSTQSITDV